MYTAVVWLIAFDGRQLWPNFQSRGHRSADARPLLRFRC